MAKRQKARGAGEASVPPAPLSSERERLEAAVASLSGLNADQLRLQWRNHLGGIAPVDLHSNLRLGPIWVKGGTEIETDASFSLNLSVTFAALSGESGLLFDCGLPGFDDGV
jgi:hypothetical protein